MDARISIITEGGRRFGFGHVVRCKALYDGFINLGFAPQMIVDGDDSVLPIMGAARHSFTGWHSEPEMLREASFQGDICIIDSYHAPATLYQELSKASQLAVFDDTNRLHYPPRTTIINGVMNINDDFYRDQNEVLLLTGIRHQCIRSEFWSVAPKVVNQDIRSILVTVGGNDIRNVIPRIVEISRSVHEGANIHVIAGSASANINELMRLEEMPRVRVHINLAVDDIILLMKAADLSISAAGQTLCELAVCGVPGVSISVIDNQDDHARAWDKAGCFSFVGSWDDADIDIKLVRSIGLISVYEERMKRSRAMSRVIDTKGALRIAQFLTGVAMRTE